MAGSLGKTGLSSQAKSSKNASGMRSDFFNAQFFQVQFTENLRKHNTPVKNVKNFLLLRPDSRNLAFVC